METLTEVPPVEQLKEKGVEVWEPQPGPQVAFHQNSAEEILYGGAAGGGKSESLLVESIRYTTSPGYHALLIRRTFPELTRSDGLIPRSKELFWSLGNWRAGEYRWYFDSGNPHRPSTVDFGHMERRDDMFKYQSAAYAYVGFDELTSFLEEQYLYLISRIRSMADVPKRIRAATNPGNDGHDWVFRRWRPWLDPTYHNRADPGELRWFARVNDKDMEVEIDYVGPKGELPMSRTFIPAFVTDNPALLAKDPGYLARLSSLPEPYRSQLKDGNWLVGHEHEYQVIPTQWIRDAMNRWTEDGGEDYEFTGAALDPARGVDNATLGYRRGPWVGELEYYNERDTMHLIGKARELYSREYGNGRVHPLRIDVIGVGAGVYDRMREIVQEMAQDVRELHKIIEPYPFLSNDKSTATDASGLLEMFNARSEMWWHMREVLDPDNPLGIDDPIMLPPDNILLADLSAPRWRHHSRGILIESKLDLKKRIGRSTDAGDNICMMFYEMGGPGEGRGGIWV